MNGAVTAVHELVSAIVPFDGLEEAHRSDTLAWLERTDDVFRRAKPAIPSRHLVAYVAVVDPCDGASLLVDHRSAGRWLPAGGHVEPGEHPTATARREAGEELGIVEAIFRDEHEGPVFVTVTETVGIGAGHVDVSLWFVLEMGRGVPRAAALGEFRSIRWWTAGEIAATDPCLFDPHFTRFVAKLGLA